MLILTHIVALLAGGAAGALLRPVAAKLVAPVLAKKALADAQALIAKSEAEAAALAAAKKLVASQPSPSTGATGATGAAAAH